MLSLVIFEQFYLARSFNIWTYACYHVVIIELPFHLLLVLLLPSNFLSYPVMFCSVISNETCNELSYFSFLGFQWLRRVLSWIWSCSPVGRTRFRCQRGSRLLCATAVTTVSLSSATFSGTSTGWGSSCARTTSMTHSHHVAMLDQK
jgi:hypothetical protein